MTLRVFITILIALSGLSASEGLKSSSIDLSSGRLYGHDFPRSLSNCVDLFGEPTLRAKVGETTILGYGNRHLFVYIGDRFHELRIDDSTHFGGIEEWIGNTHPLDNVSYQIRPGLEDEMHLKDIAPKLKAAGVDLKEEKEETKRSSKYWYRDGDFRVDLKFWLYRDGPAALSEVSIRAVKKTQEPDSPKNKPLRQRLPESLYLSPAISLTESKLYGLPIPRTPDELRRAFGEATYSAAYGPHSIYGFGQRHLFAFTDGQLAAVKIAGMHDWLNYGLTDWLKDVHELDSHNVFMIEPGISEKMQHKAIREVFKESGFVYRLTGENGLSPTELGYVVSDYHVAIEYSDYVNDTVGISEIRIAPLPQKDRGEQGGADQPATAPESKPEGDLKPKPEFGARSRQCVTGLFR